MEHGRNLASFLLTADVALQLHVGSARYDERRVEIEGIEVTYQYHPEHTWNLENFDKCVQSGIRFIRTNLGNYPYDELRITEIPYYQEDSYTMAHSIAFSEKEGWYADYSVDEIKGYLQFNLARELIRQ